MLPEQSFPVAEIMQTEDIGNSKSLDNDLSLNTSAEIAMTVKEEPCDKAAPVSPPSRSSSQEPSAADRDDTGSQNSVPVSTSTCLPNPGERGRGRGRRRSRWKLKFHHQALPPEYLDHYEAAMAQQDAAAAKSAQSKQQRPVPPLVPRRPPVIKREPEGQCTSTSPLTAAATAIERLHIVAAPSDISGKTYMDFQHRTEDSVITETSPRFARHNVNRNSERCVPPKGLLGSLLANTDSCLLADTGINKSSCESDHRRSSVIISSVSSGTDVNSNSCLNHSTASSANVCSNTANKVMNYQDLPYMGEITLDNMKPRRGRKPKKADICHLIYKNYGTVFPGMTAKAVADTTEEWHGRQLNQPEPVICNTSTDVTAGTSVAHDSSFLRAKNGILESFKANVPLNHSDVQNRIISSLLEKRLTAVSHDPNRGTTVSADYLRNVGKVESRVDTENWDKAQGTSVLGEDEEPLNLCMKDLNQLKIRLLRKHDNFYESRTSEATTVKSEPPSPSEADHTEESESLLDDFPSECVIANSEPKVMLSATPDNEGVQEGLSMFPPSVCPNPSSVSVFPFDPNSAVIPPMPSGYVYWPSTGVFVHPMALQSQLLYYQKLGAIPIVPIAPEQSQGFVQSPLPSVNILPQVTATPSPTQTNPTKIVPGKDPKSTHSKTVIPKAFSMMVEANHKNSTNSTPTLSETSFTRMKRLAPLGNPPASGAPTKKKRSAIFIPPMPSENSTNPTTEVSICKFKFTGGAKPSLQEKKMLSVDSGGNFRYYSGTGDKSMRGYEFFPRESLQQSSAASSSSPSENFLTAASTMSGGDRNIPVKDNHTQGIFPLDSSRTHVQQFPVCNDMLTRELQNANVLNRTSEQSGAHFSTAHSTDHIFRPADVGEENSSQYHLSRRKRKTRKSLAREKLEQTFKEKGFLIQTQQLESAEGATYCKFRQLRKFTRYLFRSWKDYLPGNVREMSIAAGVSGVDGSPHQSPEGAVSEGELSSSSRSSPATQDPPEQPPVD
ncbi:uncharacterized protein LOC124605321 isoform X1 [Schistocerca americana]|uniref:uncharacterized protein LOC124605321 isoform X1 n=3 Tax=Schistocerca americana TaxID=7009 RepID=UPI001F4FCFFE|nr:uncharacterized protein LOC124605321 isoform X1 [Schistocerca americana]XP_046992867.1 uncharacterized protein LOC124605321 isoform X1 [Schistocerca americana]XP_046992868.1 uncharacterized protein LOC124605321 isoform X1 [Schistocerca americana]XP_049959393.1 uncharacterized protein LOC126475514 isoform X1 [Schistocerca serialis cubense]XP_049959394.1 uncharacterized protein LOC126475514 isoform X1 [Schistocerca serialis cubense]